MNHSYRLSGYSCCAPPGKPVAISRIKLVLSRKKAKQSWPLSQSPDHREVIANIRHILCQVANPGNPAARATLSGKSLLFLSEYPQCGVPGPRRAGSFWPPGSHGPLHARVCQLIAQHNLDACSGRAESGIPGFTVKPGAQN